MSGSLTRTVYKTKPAVGDFFWMDQNRRYFVFNGGLMDKGRTYTHM